MTSPSSSSFSLPTEKKTTEFPIKRHKWEQTKKFSNVDVISSSVGNSIVYPRGSIINMVSIPKCGKTTLALQDSILLSKLKKDVLYFYNESPRYRFMNIANEIRNNLNVSIQDLNTMTFLDAHGLVLKSANFDSIKKFVDVFVIKQIEYWLEHVNNPTMIVIDSLSKFCRTYPAQAYYFAQCFTGEMWKMMAKHDKYPVVLCINQKSGGRWERDDETVLGGYGILHDMDGSILLRLRQIDKWSAKDFGMAQGSLIHTIQTIEMRGMDVDTDERLLIKENGRLKLGCTIDELIAEGGAEQNGEQW